MVCYMVPLTLFGPLAVTVMRVRVTLRRAGILLPGGSRLPTATLLTARVSRLTTPP